MIKTTPRIILLFIFCLFLVSWGSVGHKIINSKCPDSFPASMTAFKVWSDSLSTHASDADNRKNDPNEKPRHYIDIDTYPEFQSTGRIASTYDSIVSKYGTGYVVNIGVLPWATLNMYDSLVVDFQKLKWHKAMLDASDLGHYVGDGHMPLHLSSNYDGQLTGQGGIHSHYESTMVANFQTELSTYSGDTVLHIVNNVNRYIFDYIYSNHHYVDSLLAADTYAKNLTGSNSSNAYMAALWSKTHFTTMLLQNSSHSLAELIYTAWIEAGSPVFGAKKDISAVSDISDINISVYPKPTTGIINIIGTDFIKTEVSTITGSSIGIHYGKQIDLSKLSNGVYILNIYGKNRILKKEKILLAK